MVLLTQIRLKEITLNMKILGIIPARGGSKGIKNKNIRQFCGRPLISYVIDCAKKSKYIQKTIVSTESEEIVKVARRYGAEVPFLRPPQFAQDKSRVSDAIIHLLSKLKTDFDYIPDIIVLLQTTSPLRTPQDIDGAIKLLIDKKADSVVSVCATEQLVFTKDSENRLKNLITKKEFLRSNNRQELPRTFKLDGSMVYAIKTKIFLKYKSFLAGKLVGYEIPRWRSVDLDEPEDFVVGELIFSQFKKLAHKIEHFK